MRNVLRVAVGVLVLCPTTLVAGFWTLMGVAFSVDAIRRGENLLTSALVMCAIAAGWFGIVTAWRLYRRLHQEGWYATVTDWIGLACGAIVTMALMGSTGGSLVFRVSFFGWPMLAVFYLAMALRPWQSTRQRVAQS